MLHSNKYYSYPGIKLKKIFSMGGQIVTVDKKSHSRVNGVDVTSLVTIHPKRIRWMKNPRSVVSGFKHDNRLKCHRGIVPQGNSVTVDVSSGSKCHGGQNVGGRNVKAPISPV